MSSGDSGRRFGFKLEARQRGQIPVKELQEYLQRFGNVSIYDSGFRLPYYGNCNSSGVARLADIKRPTDSSNMLRSSALHA